MTKGRTFITIGAAWTLALLVALSPAWADPEQGYGHGSGGKEGYGHASGGHGMMGMGMGMMHSSTGHLIRHLLKHEKDIGLTADQVAKLKDMQLNLDKTRIKMEADIQIAERELKALIDEEKFDLAVIEAKLKQSEDWQVALRLASIKARRDVLALLTPEQRAKEKAEHEKMMQQHRETGKGPGNPHKGDMKKNEGKKQ
jgi:Spy/CpxP family protein refolding chaperone